MTRIFLCNYGICVQCSDLLRSSSVDLLRYICSLELLDTCYHHMPQCGIRHIGKYALPNPLSPPTKGCKADSDIEPLNQCSPLIPKL